MQPARPPDPEKPTAERIRIGRCRALLIGIDEYPSFPLDNAVRDARALARLLERELGFELVTGGPLLDGRATRRRILAGLAEMLEADSEPHDQNLLFFAGHGLGDGHLMVAGTGQGESAPRIPVHEVSRAFRASPARGLLILDTCYAGQALRKGDLGLDPGLGDGESGLGGIHLLAAGGPEQRAPDGPRGEHSPFTSCLLAFLDGRLGWHLGGEPPIGRISGTIPISRLSDRLEAEVAAHSIRLQARLGQGWTPPAVLVEALRPSDSGHRGLFHLVPRLPRLEPGLVRGLRAALDKKQPEERRRGLKHLAEALARSRDSFEQHLWDLPLVLDLLLQGLRNLKPRDRLRLDRMPLELGPSQEQEGAEARAATARLLGRAGSAARGLLGSETAETDHEGRARLRRDLRDTQEALLHLGVRDPDPVVRHAAAGALPKTVAEPDRPQLRARLVLLRAVAPRRARGRLRRLEARLGSTSLAQHLADTGRARLDRVLDLARRCWRFRLLRLPLKVAGWGAAALYVLILLTYHVDTGPDGRLLALLGPPGLEALPLAGDTLLPTPWYESHLAGRRLPRDPLPWGLWLTPGGIDWGRPIVRLMEDERAVPLLWRVGERSEAERRLRSWAEKGRPRALEWAAYQSLQEPGSVDVAGLAEGVLRRHDDGHADTRRVIETLGRWCAVTGVEPGEDWPTALRGSCLPGKGAGSGPAVSPDGDRHTLALDAVAEALASGDSPTRSHALRRLVLAIEEGELLPEQGPKVDRLLATALGDSLPWNRLEAADGVLLRGLAPPAVYGRALELAVEKLESDPLGADGPRLGRRFARAPPRATLRLLGRMGAHLETSTTSSDESNAYSSLLEQLVSHLVTRAPERLGEGIEALLPLLGTEATSSGVSWRWRIYGLLERRIEGLRSSGSALVTEVLEDLGSAELRRRRAALHLLPLAAPWLPDPEAVRRRLEALLSEAVESPSPDGVEVSGAARALLVSSADHPQWARKAITLIRRILGSPVMPQRARLDAARKLRSLATRAQPSRLDARALVYLAGDAEDAARASILDALLGWVERQPRSWMWSIAHLDAQLASESDPDLRAEYQALRGLILGGPASLQAVEALGRLYDQGSEKALFRASLVGSVRTEAAAAASALFASRWRQDELLGPQGFVLAARSLGEKEPELARRVMRRLLAPMLFEGAPSHGWNVLVNGVGALTRLHPSLTPEALALLDSFVEAYEEGRVPLTGSGLRLLQGAFLDVWTDLAHRRFQAAPHLLERGLRSFSGWRQSSSLVLMARIARQEPETRPGLRSTLLELRSSWRPDLRSNASRGLEILRLLDLDAGLDRPGREALRQIAEGYIDSRALPALAPE
ncbi:MAG: caspase family protein [Holophagales bacterium]|nr:caspase family protein [Holophagales bacterium]